MTHTQPSPPGQVGWQDQLATNPHRQALIEHIDPVMTAPAASLDLDPAEPEQRLAFIQRLGAWIDDARDDARDTARRQLEPGHDPSHNQPF